MKNKVTDVDDLQRQLDKRSNDLREEAGNIEKLIVSFSILRDTFVETNIFPDKVTSDSFSARFTIVELKLFMRVHFISNNEFKLEVTVPTGRVSETYDQINKLMDEVIRILKVYKNNYLPEHNNGTNWFTYEDTI